MKRKVAIGMLCFYLLSLCGTQVGFAQDWREKMREKRAVARAEEYMATRRNPTLAAFLSIFPGLGQWYNSKAPVDKRTKRIELLKAWGFFLGSVIAVGALSEHLSEESESLGMAVMLGCEGLAGLEAYFGAKRINTKITEELTR